ncbi:MAG: hypothetical protein FWE25_08075 [Lachnospiraceae bacterium]|nr:hypothetical protein [Lachnospiraceae bacterium]
MKKKKILLIVMVLSLLASSLAVYAETTVSDTAYSEQEYASQERLQLTGSAEKMRLYDFLFETHTFLMVYEARDFMEQYHEEKNLWIDAMASGAFDEESMRDLQMMLDKEAWTIDIMYPLEHPFALSHDEFLEVYFYFTEANPQFFLNQIVPLLLSCEEELLTPAITLHAYYAFAANRHLDFERPSDGLW